MLTMMVSEMPKTSLVASFINTPPHSMVHQCHWVMLAIHPAHTCRCNRCNIPRRTCQHIPLHCNAVGFDLPTFPSCTEDIRSDPLQFDTSYCHLFFLNYSCHLKQLCYLIQLHTCLERIIFVFVPHIIPIHEFFVVSIECLHRQLFV